MARFTPVVQHPHDVIGICRLLIVGLVTRETICVLQRIVVVDMTLFTPSDRVLAR